MSGIALIDVDSDESAILDGVMRYDLSPLADYIERNGEVSFWIADLIRELILSDGKKYSGQLIIRRHPNSELRVSEEEFFREHDTTMKIRAIMLAEGVGRHAYSQGVAKAMEATGLSRATVTRRVPKAVLERMRKTGLAGSFDNSSLTRRRK